jgi:AcrR family transcriptional regulator
MKAEASSERPRSPRVYPVRPMLPRAVVESHRRERFAIALSDLVHEQGEVVLTVTEVIGKAESSRNTFYETFRSKEGCFEYACVWARERLLSAIGAAAQAGEGEERMRAVIRALLKVAAELPAPVELCLVHSTADSDAREGVGDVATVDALARALVPGRDDGDPAIGSQLIAAGIVALIAVRLHRGQLTALAGLEEDLMGLAQLEFGASRGEAR